ncbi:MAG: hypothetical protein ACIWVG_31095, partial [Gloeotrichia echinulata HAB0833]
MTIPQKPSTEALKTGLTNVSRVVKTSKFKFSNWNLKPFSQLMTRFSAKDYKNFADLAKSLREQKGLLTELKKIKETAKIVKDSKDTLDKVLSKVPGGSLPEKAGKGGIALGQAIILAASIGLTLTAIWAQDQVQNQDIKASIWTESEIQKAFDRYQKNLIKIRQLNRQSDKYNLEIQRTKDRVYALEKQQIPVRDKANNALYEVREGRKILEGRIADAKKQANDALYEVRAGRKILEQRILEQAQKIADVSKRLITFDPKQFDALKSQFNSNIEILKKNFSNIQESLIAQKNAIDSQKKALSEQQKDLASTKPLVAQALDLAKQINPATLTQNIVKIVDGKIEVIQVQLKQLQPQLAGIIKTSQGTEAETKKLGVTVTSIDGVIGGLRETYNKTYEALAAKWNEEQSIISAKFLDSLKKGTATTTIIKEGIDYVDERVNEAYKQGQNTQKQVKDIGIDLSKQAQDIQKIKDDLKSLDATDSRVPALQAQINGLTNQIKEQDRLNKLGLDKINDLALMVGGLTPFMNKLPKQTADLINPNIPTPKDIEKSVGTGICNSANGGCLNTALNKNADNINKNSNANNNGILDKLNAGLQIPELALLKTINDKLGEQLPDGIGGKLTRLSKWLHLDRALNILIWWQTLHNAYMLSSNLGQTLTGMISNVLAVFGIKDAEGSPLDIGEILGGQFDNLAKSVLGESQWGSIKAEWKKWNRIYQAAANLMNSIQSIGYSILSALEVVGSWVAFIGNALRKFGKVGDDAYRWMNPSPNFQNKFFTTLEKAEDVVSQL